MKISAKWSVALVATVLTAGELEPKILRLIGPEARFVFGLDLERYEGSQLAKVFPSRVEHLLPSNASEARPQLRSVVGIAISLDGAPLSVIVTATPMPQLTGDGITLHLGVRVREDEQTATAVLDPSTAVVGRLVEVKDAIERWGLGEPAGGEIAGKVREISRTYDNWFLVVRPLDAKPPDRSGDTRLKTQVKYRTELAQAIEEVRVGVRLGAINDITVEVVAKSADEAMALAVIGRYLPGLIAAANPYGPPAGLVESADHITTRAEGRTASLSFSLAESKLEEWLRAQKGRRVE